AGPRPDLAGADQPAAECGGRVPADIGAGADRMGRAPYLARDLDRRRRPRAGRHRQSFCAVLHLQARRQRDRVGAVAADRGGPWRAADAGEPEGRQGVRGAAVPAAVGVFSNQSSVISYSYHMKGLAAIAGIGLLLGAGPRPSLHDAFNAQKCYAYTAEVAGFGMRNPGSPGHAKTEALVQTAVQGDGGAYSRDDFEAKTPRGPIQVRNLIGKFNVSKDPKQPIFILAGHYDTLFQKGFVGANDGGSSTAILISFADALHAAQPTKMQIWLVWTDLEEAINSFTDSDGLYGSRHLANKLKAEGLVPRIKGFFLLDMIGDANLNVDRESTSTGWLQDFI